MSAITYPALLFLGAAPHLTPPIKYAKRMGYRVINEDHTPTNPGHAPADSSYDISTTDAEEIIKLAQAEGIDGIVA